MTTELVVACVALAVGIVALLGAIVVFLATGAIYKDHQVFKAAVSRMATAADEVLTQHRARIIGIEQFIIKEFELEKTEPPPPGETKKTDLN